MFYSKTTNGFYDPEIHGSNIPKGAKEISLEQYKALMEGQAKGQQIKADKSGYPVLVDYAPTDEEAALNVRVQRDRLLTESDWTQLSDTALTEQAKAQWQEYRTELRDITKQTGFPQNVVYPEKPKG